MSTTLLYWHQRCHSCMGSTEHVMHGTRPAQLRCLQCGVVTSGVPPTAPEPNPVPALLRERETAKPAPVNVGNGHEPEYLCELEDARKLIRVYEHQLANLRELVAKPAPAASHAACSECERWAQRVKRLERRLARINETANGEHDHVDD